MAEIGELRRGDCVFVINENAVGAELKKNRHAVVVSNPAVCMNSPALQVVYLSKKHKQKRAPYHVQLNDGRCAMCEHIYTVDLSRMTWTGPRLSKQEMIKINSALKLQLQLDWKHELRETDV